MKVKKFTGPVLLAQRCSSYPRGWHKPGLPNRGTALLLRRLQSSRIIKCFPSDTRTDSSELWNMDARIIIGRRKLKRAQVFKLILPRYWTLSILHAIMQPRSFDNSILYLEARGNVVVKTLGYKPESRGFETRWGEILNLPNLPAALGPGVHSASNRNEYRKHWKKIMFLGSKVLSVRGADNLTAINEPIV
jgi:hypothetical protein